MEFTWRIFLRLVAELYGVQRESLCKGGREIAVRDYRGLEKIS